MSSDSFINRTAYFFGVTLRQATEVLAVPFRAVSEMLSRGDVRDVRRPPDARSLWRRKTGDVSRSDTPRRTLPKSRGDRVPLDASRAAARDGMAALSKVLADPDPRVRKLALDTVAEFEEERAAQLILAVLNDPDPGVRSAAAQAAGRAKASSTVFSLILSLDDVQLEVREAAKQAIEHITGEVIDLDPAASLSVREIKVNQLKQWWKERRMSQLIARIESDDS